MLIIGDLAVIGEYAMEDLLRFESIKHRLQGVIDRQHMGDGAACRQRQDNFAFQSAFGEQIQ